MNLVVAHDAGSALILRSFFFKKKNTDYFLGGPAKKILNIKNFFNKTKQININKYSQIFFGTSLVSRFEVSFLKKIEKEKVKKIVFFDSWLNFKNRLVFKKKLILPDEIWVFDDVAKKNAKKIFGKKVLVKKKNNYYLNYLKSKIIVKKNNKSQKILYIAGLIFKRKKNLYHKIEYKCLNNFLKNYKLFNKNYSLSVRPHPNENRNRFQRFINPHQVSIKTLEKDISESKIIVGAQSMALFYSSFLNKRTYCVLPIKKRFYKPTIKLKTFHNKFLCL